MNFLQTGMMLGLSGLILLNEVNHSAHLDEYLVDGKHVPHRDYFFPHQTDPIYIVSGFLPEYNYIPQSQPIIQGERYELVHE